MKQKTSTSTLKTPKRWSKWTARLASFCLLLVTAFLVLSLYSYNQTDASFDQAIDGGITNWGGAAGAYISRSLLSFLGIGAYLVPAISAFWGYRIAKEHYLPHALARVPFLLALLVSCSSLVAFYPYVPSSWPFRTLGGFIGEYMMVNYTPLIGAAAYAIIGLLMFPVSFFLASALRFSECRSIAIAFYRYSAIVVFAVFSACKWLVTKLIRKPERRSYAFERDTSFVVEERKTVDVEIPQEPSVAAKKRAAPIKQTSLKLTEQDFELPYADFLTPAPAKAKKQQVNQTALEQNARLLEKILSDFGVQGEITRVRPGPVVTLYELEPAAGTKSSRVIGLADDIARSMSAVSARIAVIPGRNAIGIELPNVKRETVYLRDIFESEAFRNPKINLPLALGKSIGGEAIVADLAKMPHLLVAGTTGSGKSVAINCMILSLLYRLRPDECRFIMIDPKMLELSVYDGIPHLLSPVVTEPSKAIIALRWVVREMEDRYRLMSHLGVRNMPGFNKRIEEAQRQGERLTRQVQTGFDAETGTPIIEEVAIDMKPLPFIVVVVDEMADLMLVAGKDIEGAIQRLAQMARAAGIHIIMATQRPSVDVITGVIKANFPTRISFQVTSKIDSRTILGEMGAEQLLGMGDMLYMAGGSKIERVHGPFVDDGEVERVVSFLKEQGAPNYVEAVTEEDDVNFDSALASFGSNGGDSENQLYDQAVAIVLRDKRASTSYIQRQLKIGYNRAANLIERMEQEGVLSSPNHVGKREILVNRQEA